MKLRLHTRMAGPKFNRAPGFVYDADKEEGEAMIDGKFASVATKDDIKEHAKRQAKVKSK